MKTFQEVISAAPDTYIEGGFEAYVTQPRQQATKTGKSMFKCKLSDGGASVIDASSFSVGFEQYEGRKVRFSGMGIKRKPEYNGQAQVSFGDRVVMTALTDNGAAPQTQQAQAAPNVTTIMKPKEPVNPALRIADMGSLFVLCYKEAGRTADACGQAENFEAIRTIATTYFIQATKDGLLAGR